MHVVGYIKSTIDFGLCFSREGSLKPVGFVDASYGDCNDTKRSTSGQVFMMAGGPVSWSAKRQVTVSVSTVESEYVAAAKAAQQMKWLLAWLEEVGLPQELPGHLHLGL